ncbi:protein detoxification 19 [Quercus suber]|uniref:Protein detoxification 19 n=1 Tax=Quercus suber TaxID=58331 RepID=A0AAW0LYR2_QUESU
MAALYLVPELFAYGFLQKILRFLQEQSIVWPLVIVIGPSLVTHVEIAYALVHWTSLNLVGAPVAASVSLCVDTEAIAYMFSYGLNAAISTRVSNELGAGLPIRAKNAMGVSLKLSLLVAVLLGLAIGFGHNTV